jgi:hypothetical protein
VPKTDGEALRNAELIRHLEAGDAAQQYVSATHMAQAAEQADDEAEVPPVEDDDDEIVTAQVVSAALGTTGPREAIREFALSNPGSASSSQACWRRNERSG